VKIQDQAVPEVDDVVIPRNVGLSSRCDMAERSFLRPPFSDVPL
jgi:hypothetical protein